MSDRQKIHVFLGAPPPTRGPASGPPAGGGEERRPPADWRHLELRWQDGHLKAAPDVTGSRLPEEAIVPESEEPLTLRSDETDQDHRKPESDWTTEEDPQQEVQCSASVLEYLDSCFSAHRSPPTPLSTHTHFLSTWTLSQALILKGRHAVQSASSPERTLPPRAPSENVSLQAPPLQTLSRETRHSQAPPPQLLPPQTPPLQTPLPQTPPPQLLPPQIPHSQTPPPLSQAPPLQTPPPQATPPSMSSSTPELFSPLTLSPLASSLELFSAPCWTEGGVVVEVTPDGVLMSQNAERLDSPSKSPDKKRAWISETPKSRGGPTLLDQCALRGGRYSVLVAVVHPSHLKEVKVRSGPCVPLASIVVTDQSGVEMKVVLWRRAAFWALTVTPGEILLITALQVNEDKWRAETVLQSTFSSKLLNMGSIADSASPTAPQQVTSRSLLSLCSYLRERRPLLVSQRLRPPQDPRLRPPQDPRLLPYATLRSLRVNTLVHALLRVTHTHLSTAWRSEAQSCLRSALQQQGVLRVQQHGAQQGALLLLWGTAVDWLPQFKDKAAVWDFRALLVRDSLTSDLLELHSTPWSSVRPLNQSDPRLKDFLQKPELPAGGLELDLDTLLSQKYSGENAPGRVDSCSSLQDVVAVLSDDVTFTGCYRCAAELQSDANGIYRPCYSCLPITAVRRYYRPGVLTVRGRGLSQVCVQVPPVPLQKILEAPPDRLHRNSAPGSEVKFVALAAQKLQSLVILPRKAFVLSVRSHFLCDENSVPLHQDLTLLDLQFPGSP
ncbi:hypothetical protein CgunFtcFv8_017006 [Champsocephalus gunnari]|uniref:Shieldin complex subunit 2 n=1 Tax=Champsocephalus gunnari TaxID=52237 RepID=A0AAN8HDX4_CHAGU|nr:hypothetical protein CgunFtcFv8_017006 [Champsocephalus gunnari]